MVKVNDIRWKLANQYEYNNFVTDKTGTKTIEIVNATFIANEDYIFRSPNQDYIKREIEWYKSQSLEFTLSFPPNSLILKIVSGIPYVEIRALNPGIVPLDLSK